MKHFLKGNAFINGLISLLKKCPNFIRTIGWHLDNLMQWLVRMGNTGVWGNVTCGNLW